MSEHTFSVRDYLGHMQDFVARIDRYMLNKSSADFLYDTLIQDAVIRNLELLGEASRNILRLQPDAPALYPQIPFPAIYAMRNLLIHGYAAVDIDVVSKVVERDVPVLRAALHSVLD